MSKDIQIQAFPVPAGTWHTADGEGNSYGDGMTLRDYFAAKAMQAMIASGNQEAIENLAIQAEGNAPKGVALAAYGFADAMLKIRDN